MQNIIEQYLKSKEYKWSESTFNSERPRLLNLLPVLHLEPQALVKFLTEERGLKLLTIKTIFIRLSDFKEWQLTKGLAQDNPYKSFLENNYLFKNAYKKKSILITYEEAENLLKDNNNTWGLYLLQTGVRLSELYTIKKEGVRYTVHGKQGKTRAIFLAPPSEELPNRQTLQRSLKKLGLMPHMLRKLFATQLVQKGVHIKDLMTICGWSSMQTADSYLQSTQEDKLRGLIYGVTI